MSLLTPSVVDRQCTQSVYLVTNKVSYLPDGLTIRLLHGMTPLGQNAQADCVVNCPICGDSQVYRRFIKRDRAYWRCRNCALDFQWPVPTAAELLQYYERSYREGLYKTFVDAEQMKAQTAAYRYKVLSDKVQGSLWLDVGCADGQFLSVLHARGHAATGIDVSEVAVQRAQQRGLDARVAALEEFPANTTFDVITAFDVLEHVRNPIGFLRSARDMMHAGSYFAITTPNLNSLLRHVMGRRWYFYIPDEHLHLFSRLALDHACRQVGLRILRCGPIGKPLTLRYGLTQFQEYNPVVYRLLRPVVQSLPGRLRDLVIPYRIGELLAVACRETY